MSIEFKFKPYPEPLEPGLWGSEFGFANLLDQTLQSRFRSSQKVPKPEPNQTMASLLTSLIGGKVNIQITPPEVPTDSQLRGWQDSSACSAAYKATWAASFQATLSPTCQHVQPFLNTYAFYMEMVGKVQKWMPSPLIIHNAQQAILRVYGDVDALVMIWQGQSESNISLDNLINIEFQPSVTYDVYYLIGI